MIIIFFLIRFKSAKNNVKLGEVRSHHAHLRYINAVLSKNVPFYYRQMPLSKKEFDLISLLYLTKQNFKLQKYMFPVVFIHQIRLFSYKKTQYVLKI